MEKRISLFLILMCTGSLFLLEFSSVDARQSTGYSRHDRISRILNAIIRTLQEDKRGSQDLNSRSFLESITENILERQLIYENGKTVPATHGNPDNKIESLGERKDVDLDHQYEESEYGPDETIISKRNFDKNSILWPDGQVPYVVKGFKNTNTTFLRRAITIMHEETCVEFLNIGQYWENINSDEILPSGDKVNFKHTVLIDGNNKNCDSYVGVVKVEGQSHQVIGLNKDGCNSVQTALHEFMHCLGMQHEQSRSDRAFYIHMLYRDMTSAMVPQNGRERTFDKTPYDLFSTLQYMLDSSSKVQGKDSMLLNDPRLKYLTTNKKTLDYLDTLEINKRYGCTKNCKNVCGEWGYRTKTYADIRCHCKCIDGLTGETCSAIDGNCGKIIHLKASDPTDEITVPMDNQLYESNLECFWPVLAPKGWRIRARIEHIDIPVYSKNYQKKCDHWLEVRFNLVSDPGVYLCGKIKKEDNVSYLKSLNRGEETNQMILAFNSKGRIKYQNQFDDLPRGSGVKVKLEAYKSACVSNPCQHFGKCTDLPNGKHKCTCSGDGYVEGTDCREVKENGRIACSFDDDINGKCDLKVDKGRPGYWRETFSLEKAGKVVLKAKEGFVFGTFTGSLQRDDAVLITTQKFRPAKRCLSFCYFVERDTDDTDEFNTPTSLDVYFSAKNFPKFYVLENYEGSIHISWECLEVMLPKVENLQIVFRGVTGSKTGGIDNMELKPTCSNYQPCANHVCANGGLCVANSGKPASCACARGFMGTNCDQRETNFQR